MVSTVSDIRTLLRNLREVMAEPIDAQSRLNKIVALIAANMESQVCSVYVIQDDGNLELYATEGLNKEAVHFTKLKKGEGLVGLVAEKAEPLAVMDARQHPAYSFKPETGEEELHSLLGVPLLRAGNVLGVLVVQSKNIRKYGEDEIEGMQITAMVLAEILASSIELQLLAPRGTRIGLERPLYLKGISLAPGIGMGYAVLHEPRIIIKNIVAIDPEREVERLEKAISEVRASIDRLFDDRENNEEIGSGSEHLEVLETFRMFAHDPGWLRRMREAVFSGLTAEAAVERVQSDFRARLTRQSDPYLRDRLHDLDDLAHRLLHHLVGNNLENYRGSLPQNAIVVARSLGPAALLDYDRTRLRGLILEEGGASSHVAIVARALGIPVVSEITNITAAVETGQPVIVDGITGDVQIRPKVDVQTSYAEKVRLLASQQKKYRDQRDIPSITKDGVTVSLFLNAGLPMDLSHVEETGAKGIGLFRTELQFLIADHLPSTNEQQKLYEEAYRIVGDKPITFRTLDVGGDKVIPYMPKIEEENPALGWRALRIGLDRPGLLRAQIRALMRASVGRTLRIMFPMAASSEEFARAKQIVEQEKKYLSRHLSGMPKDIQLGLMLEVPSLLFQLDSVCQMADFISVGSNDLLQFLFAADRDNPKVANRYDVLSAPSLRALKSIVDATQFSQTPVMVCGEMASRPLEAMALVGLGFRSLSMAPTSIGVVKAALLETNVAQLTELVDDAVKQGHSFLRQTLISFAEKSGIPIE